MNTDGPDDAIDDGEAAEQRDLAGGVRDDAGGLRDLAGAARDALGEDRDSAGTQRDVEARRRDRAAEERDRSAQHRDADDAHADAHGEADDGNVAKRALAARQRAAEDRGNASRDRASSAVERGWADGDRLSAQADRADGAEERISADGDRASALADRGASAADRAASYLDGLTGAYLRGPGFHEIDREVARVARSKVPLVLTFVDVDGLKVVNDEQGHPAGDQVLVLVAATVRSYLRPYDLLVRYGGDEFVCVVAGLPLADVRQRFERVQVALAGRASVSIGLAALRPNEVVGALVARADADLYQRRRRLHPG